MRVWYGSTPVDLPNLPAKKDLPYDELLAERDSLLRQNRNLRSRINRDVIRQARQSADYPIGGF
jgi:hypothetical protein